MASANIPNFHFAVFASGDALPIVAKGDALAALAVRKAEEPLARLPVPQLHIVRDRILLAQTLIVPMVQLLVLSNAATFEIRNTPI